MDYADGEFTYYPLVSETYWMIQMDNMKVAGAQTGNLKAIVDTGTSAIVGPKNIISDLIKNLPQ